MTASGSFSRVARRSVMVRSTTASEMPKVSMESRRRRISSSAAGVTDEWPSTSMRVIKETEARSPRSANRRKHLATRSSPARRYTRTLLSMTNGTAIGHPIRNGRAAATGRGLPKCPGYPSPHPTPRGSRPAAVHRGLADAGPDWASGVVLHPPSPRHPEGGDGWPAASAEPQPQAAPSSAPPRSTPDSRSSWSPPLTSTRAGHLRLRTPHHQRTFLRRRGDGFARR